MDIALCMTEKHHPVPGLLNLSTRRRGDVDRPKLLLACAKTKTKSADVHVGGGPRGLDRIMATRPPGQRENRRIAKAETARHCINPLL